MYPWVLEVSRELISLSSDWDGTRKKVKRSVRDRNRDDNQDGASRGKCMYTHTHACAYTNIIRSIR